MSENRIPLHWEKKKLEDIIDVLTDYTANGSFEALRVNVRYYYEQNYAALVRATDLGKAEFTPKVFTDERGYFFQKKTSLFGGEIVLANVGSIGNVYKVPSYSMPMTLAPNTYLVRFNQSVSQDYIYHFLNSEFYLRQLIQKVGSTALAAINKDSFRSIEIALPKQKSEQTAIAKVLDTLDTAIQQTEAIVDKLNQIKQGLLHDLLTCGVDANGELRPSYEQAPHLYKESPLGWVPKDWEIVTLGQIAARSSGILQTGPFGSQLHAHEYAVEGIPVVMPQDMVGGRLSVSHIARIPQHKAVALSRHRLTPNDVIFSRRGDLSRCVAIEEEHTGWLCGTGCLLARLSSRDINGFWLALIYQQPCVQSQVLGRAVGSTMANLNTSILSELMVGRPDINEQNEIARRLKAATQRIDQELTVLAKLKKQKSGLMDDLLTGRVRVTPLLAQSQ